MRPLVRLAVRTGVKHAQLAQLLRELVIGTTLPRGTRVKAVEFDGRRVRAQVRTTNRGEEVTVATRPGRHVLEVR